MRQDLPKLMKVTDNGGTLDVEYYLRKEYENIADAAIEIPNAICWLAEVRGWAARRFINSENAWKQAEAKAYFALKTGGEFQSRGFGEKITEDALKHAVQLDPVVIECGRAYADYKRKLIMVEEAIECLKLKIDLVRSKETTRRLIADDSEK